MILSLNTKDLMKDQHPLFQRTYKAR